MSEIDRVRRQLVLLRIHAVLSTFALTWLGYRELMPAESGTIELVRTRGIIVEDAEGRDRILIGAPVPESTDRVRTDIAKVRALWAESLGGDAYLEGYASYDHGANGMIVLSPEGHDRLAVGDGLPDPNTGKRIAIPTGMVWNDHEGFELGGIGANRLLEGGKYRNTLGFDDPGGEGLHLVILEDGSKVLRFVHPEGMLVVGRLAPNSLFGNREEFLGLRALDQQGKVLFDLPARALEPTVP